MPQLDRLLEHHDPDANYRVIGYVFRTASGSLQSAGDFDPDNIPLTPIGESKFIVEKGIYCFSTYLSGTDTVYLRVDASSVNTYMQNYIFRILGMVVVITLFLTGACLLFLTPLLINPLQRINLLLKKGEKEGIRNLSESRKDIARNDEIGGINRSLQGLRHTLIRTEDEKNRVTDRFETFANLGADCFWEVDSKLKITYFSGDVSRMFGTNSEQLIGQSSKHFLQRISRFVPGSENIRNSLVNNGSWEGKIYSDLHVGTIITVRVIATMIRNETGKFIGIRGTITDISTETGLASELKYQANHDELTGLANRRHLTCQLDVCIEKYIGEGEEFALLVMDLDRFKQVNDTGGHAAGDALLKNLSSRFKAIVRETDTVARMGGDEFAIILRSCTLEAAKDVAEKIRTAVETFTFTWEDEDFTVSISIGVAQVTPDLMNREAMVLAADTCCIKAKDLGKNQIQVYSISDNSLILFKDEARLVSRISKAIEHDQLVLFRQSIANIKAPDSEDHFEILLRMLNDNGEYLLPAKFLTIAERNQLMPRIDRWVVTNAFNWLRSMNYEPDAPVCMNVNLSAASLADSMFCEFIIDCVQANRKIAKFVCFEMTETAVMINFDQTVALLQRLKSFGCTIALDDFGTGFSSLSHIRDLPLDYIKIDGRFIEEITHNNIDQAVVKSVADIASVLGIKTVAEFVDTETKLETLRKMGIDYAQGYLFSKPEALDVSDSDNDRKAA